MNSKKLLCMTFLILLVLGISATLWAQNAVYNRPNPTMDYVPQEIAIYDTMYYEHAEHNCRKCHGNSTADRHHGVPMVVRDHLCTPCHPTCTVGDPDCENGITIHRDCLTSGCHSWDDVQFGNEKWHHNTDMADSENCIACHDPNIIEEITPVRTHEQYPPTVATPTPFSCENCHWYQPVSGGVVPPDGDTPKHPATYDHYDLWGNCVGFTEYGKPIYNNIDTHHMDFVGEVASECYKCHSQDPGNPSWDPYNPELMRYCMICHSIKTLHTIGPHVSEHPGWEPVGFHAGGPAEPADPTIYNTWDYDPCNPNPDPAPFPYTSQVKPGYTADEQCFGCHGDDVDPWDPGTIGMDPAIDTGTEGLQPNWGSCGAIVTLRGDYFGSEHIEGRDVQMAPKNLGKCTTSLTSCTADSQCPVGETCDNPKCNWPLKTDLPIHAWNDTLIEVEIPCWQFAPGNYCVRVKTEEGLSNSRTFSYEDSPTLLAVTDGTSDPDAGPCSEWLTLTGSGGFGVKQSKMGGDDYHGRHVVVDFVASSGEYTATHYKAGPNWTDTSIQVQLYDLFQDGDCSQPTETCDKCSIDPLTGQKRMNRNFVQDKGAEGFCNSHPAVVCSTDADCATWPGEWCNKANPTLECDLAAPMYDECAYEPTILRCDCLALGTFSIYVKAIYFGDDDGSASDGIDNDLDGTVDDADEGLTCGDTIFEVEKSDPVYYELTNEPVINKLNPKRVVDANAAPFPLLKVYGGNFGVSQATGDTVRAGTKAQASSVTLGLGKELKPINLWSDTLIKLRVKAPDTWRGKTRYVWVEKGGVKSNYKPLAILAP